MDNIIEGFGHLYPYLLIGALWMLPIGLAFAGIRYLHAVYHILWPESVDATVRVVEEQPAAPKKKAESKHALLSEYSDEYKLPALPFE